MCAARRAGFNPRHRTHRGTAVSRPKQAFALGLVVLLFAWPAQALRCNGRLVVVGDHEIEVLERCGDPMYVRSRTVYPFDVAVADVRFSENQLAGPGAQRNNRLLRIAHLPIREEEWVYDLGSRKFRQLLHFRDGRLVEIESIAKPQ